MEVDEEKVNVPTNYRAIKYGGKAVDSDHVLVELNLNLNIVPTKPARTPIYNFKSHQGRTLFQQLTSETSEFTDCFNSMQPLQLQCEQWKETVMSHCNKAFPKIRIRTGRIKTSAADKSIIERNLLKKKEDINIINTDETIRLKYLEKYISETIAE